MRTAPPGRHCDGNGLYLFVQPSGTRSWVQRLTIRGHRRELGLGSVALVWLAEAREKARASRKLAREGGDPLAERRRTQGVPSFAKAAARVVEQKQAGWRDPNTSRNWMSSLERFHRTLLDEHLRVKGRTTWYETVEEMQADLEAYLKTYNRKRRHRAADAWRAARPIRSSRPVSPKSRQSVSVKRRAKRRVPGARRPDQIRCRERTMVVPVRRRRGWMSS